MESSASELFSGQPGLDAQIRLQPDGRVRIRQFNAGGTHVDTTYIDVDERGGTIRIEGNVTRLQGELRGRVTILCGATVSITGNLRYVDDHGRRSRDLSYDGDSMLGVVAATDIRIDSEARLNALLLSIDGRIRVHGIASPGHALAGTVLRVCGDQITFVPQSELNEIPAFGASIPRT